MDVSLFLCDFAQVSEGKLTAVGIGWERRPAGNLPFGLGLVMKTGWEETNRKHQVGLRLMDADGQPVADGNGNGLEASMEMEVGRPPGAVPGTSFTSCQALNISWPLGPGRYQWLVLVDGQEVPGGSVTFDVFAAPPSSMKAA